MSLFFFSFSLKANQKVAIFVWIIITKVCRNRERYHLKSWHLLSAFKPWNKIKTVFLFPFEFDLNSWGLDRAKKTSRKRLGKPRKFLRDSGRRLCYFSNSFPVLFDCFVVFTSCTLHLEVSRQKRQSNHPHPDGKFFVFDLNGLGILRDEYAKSLAAARKLCKLRFWLIGDHQHS